MGIQWIIIKDRVIKEELVLSQLNVVYQGYLTDQDYFSKDGKAEKCKVMLNVSIKLLVMSK